MIRVYIYSAREQESSSRLLSATTAAVVPPPPLLPASSTAEHWPALLLPLRQWQTQFAMDNSGKEKEAMQLMAEADKKVKASGSFLGGMFG